MKIEDVFVKKAEKYNHYIEADRHEGCSCKTCVRKHFSYPYTCNDGWNFIQGGDSKEKGETCLNWEMDRQCKVD